MRKPSGRRVKDLVAQGKSLDDIQNSGLAISPPAAPGGGGRGPGFPCFTTVVYQELTKKPA